jgi:hypothetical protein
MIVILAWAGCTGALSTQAGAAAGAAACNDLAAANGCHAGAKAVTALAHQLARLKRTFHFLISRRFDFRLKGGPRAGLRCNGPNPDCRKKTCARLYGPVRDKSIH